MFTREILDKVYSAFNDALGRSRNSRADVYGMRMHFTLVCIARDAQSISCLLTIPDTHGKSFDLDVLSNVSPSSFTLGAALQFLSCASRTCSISVICYLIALAFTSEKH